MSSKWIRIDHPFILPEYIKDALRVLDDAGHIAYVVGGSVRDFMMGRAPKDHDLVTSATPDELVRLFPKAITIGKQFGVIKIPHPEDDFEIATFRQDLEYKDHRHPTGVLFAGPEQDAARRDFTINALYFDPKTQRILDIFNGSVDIQKKIIRAIGKPEVRFEEDSLRLLRAIRFTTTLGFQIEAETAAAIKKSAPLIKKISGERIRDELERMFKGPSPAESVELLSKKGLLAIVLPEVEALKKIPQAVQKTLQNTKEDPVFLSTIRVLRVLGSQNSKPSTALVWAALLLDIGKSVVWKTNQGKSYNGHEIEGAKLVKQIGSRLKFTKQEVERISTLVLEHIRFKDVFQMREATLLRWIKQAHFKELLALHKADATVSDGNLAFYEFCESRLREYEDSEVQVTLLDGKDLIQLGFSPGPLFTEILETVEDLVLEKKIKTKQQALEYVIETFVE